MIMFSDGSVYHLNISWALPVTWPGAVYSLEVGIIGTNGVLTIDDTHRDIVLAVSKAQLEGYNPDTTRLVDFMGSYPPGDMALGELRGPMADETVSWLNRVALGLPTRRRRWEAHTQPDADQGARSLGQAQAAGQMPLEPGTSGGVKVSSQPLDKNWNFSKQYPGRRLADWSKGIVHNSTISWGWPSKLFHWIAALAILILLVHGWWMTHMVTTDRGTHYVWHAAIGYDLIALLILRLLWRWMNPVPAMPVTLKRWEVLAAWAGHIGLYILMFAAAVSGWALAGTGRRPFNLDMFGLQVPPIVTDRTLHRPLEDWHLYLSYALAALVVVHIIGALRHHVIKRNDVMRRMWFGGKAAPHDADQPIAPASAKTLGP